jgi:hypothetical protein
MTERIHQLLIQMPAPEDDLREQSASMLFAIEGRGLNSHQARFFDFA